MNGAFGDIASDNLLALNHIYQCDEKSMLRAAHIITGETMRLMDGMSFHDSIELEHGFEDLVIPVRLPAAATLIHAKDILKRVDDGENIDIQEQLFAFGTIELHNNFKDNPRDTIPLHAIKIGDIIILTQPCELFCYFGLEIKRRSPKPGTIICGIADGYCGYCPTSEAIMGGGYSGVPISWTRLVENAGYQIVDAASRLIREVD